MDNKMKISKKEWIYFFTTLFFLIRNIVPLATALSFCPFIGEKISDFIFGANETMEIFTGIGFAIFFAVLNLSTLLGLIFMIIESKDYADKNKNEMGRIRYMPMFYVVFCIVLSVLINCIGVFM